MTAPIPLGACVRVGEDMGIVVGWARNMGEALPYKYRVCFDGRLVVPLPAERVVASAEGSEE